MDKQSKKAEILNLLDPIEREAFEHWEDYTYIEGNQVDEVIQDFREAFQGVFESPAEYAREFLESTEIIQPDCLVDYIDYTKYWVVLENAGYFVAYIGYRKCLIFQPV